MISILELKLKLFLKNETTVEPNLIFYVTKSQRYINIESTSIVTLYLLELCGRNKLRIDGNI
jgi:hypothetical protein